ncbi:NUDIX hydrolase [Wukongibacter baidiensis]|uniref:NUDIX hydrolase n=1 Tax=Wukongibacter baidiensis TaxID=1723361 RepID=UPI003D7F77FA
MKSQGAFAVIINSERNKILLVKRKDFPIWDLPGGTIESGESADEAVVRETIEEVGYITKIQQKIGEYDRVKFNDIQHVFLTEIVGGKEIKNGEETSDIKWFNLNQLPLLMVPHRKEQIRDYIRGDYPSTKVLKDSWWLVKIMELIK